MGHYLFSPKTGRFHFNPSIKLSTLHRDYKRTSPLRPKVGGKRHRTWEPKFMYRMTIGHEWAWKQNYESIKLQAWDVSEKMLELRRWMGRWDRKVLRFSAEDMIATFPQAALYVEREGRWRAGTDEWFEWKVGNNPSTVNTSVDRVSFDKDLIGTVEGPRREVDLK